MAVPGKHPDITWDLSKSDSERVVLELARGEHSVFLEDARAVEVHEHLLSLAGSTAQQPYLARIFNEETF